MLNRTPPAKSALEQSKPCAASVLGQVSMVCANFGNGPAMRDVLHDWFGFLGGKPGEVVVVDGGSDEPTQRVCMELFREGAIDKLQLIGRDHPENSKDLCYIQEYAAGALASRPYILFFKFDTLPYRRGHDGWLAEAFAHLERPEVFAVGGSFNADSLHHEAWPGWYYSHKCSENFCLMKRETFAAAMSEFAGDYIASGFRGVSPAAATGQERYLVEVAFERFIERHRRYTLVKREDETWTVFHTNCSGERLADVRRKYLERHDVMGHADAGSGRYGAESRYYGLPGVPLGRRIRMAIGATVAGPYWRMVKEALSARGRTR